MSTAPIADPDAFVVSPARLEDIQAITELVDRAITALLPHDLPPAQVAASRHIMGVDRELIADGTYLCVWAGPVLVACGG